jgi:hypothetical protein
VVASVVVLAADFTTLKASVETVSIAGTWRGRVTLDLIDAHAFRRQSWRLRSAPEMLCGQFSIGAVCWLIRIAA